MEKCPICGLEAQAITNIHTTREHKIAKKEVISKYGSMGITRPTVRRRIKADEE
jgi:hypothetical protein